MVACRDRKMVSRNTGESFTSKGPRSYPTSDRDAQIPHCERSPRNYSERLKYCAKSCCLSRAPKHDSDPGLSGGVERLLRSTKRSTIKG